MSVVKGRITVRGNNANRINKKLTFNDSGPFKSCILKINNTLIDNAENLDIVMPMYNLLEYSGNYSMTSESLWNYYRDKVNDDVNKIDNNNSTNRLNNNKIVTSKSFEYKTKLIGSTPNKNNILDAEDIVPLTYLSNFWRFFDLLLISCEIELVWNGQKIA